ncbi:uncharacterized protein METZ01_LOCUS94850 [marine metagenome]|uniref:SMP-30/Gluconolactonase/LRE-like region domain-containing protein n=1 Tax=marine metagenome TaxID=408172 RepID=A0A381VNU4_9ZZZZ|tara:strand:+ start:114 stop:1127 length:1014 start_codon:yes stop_codon:yes gene_type:complete
MPITRVAGNKAFSYVDNIGKIGQSATGFFYPYGLARGQNDVVYVACWGHEFLPSARITKIEISTQKWLLDIGHPENGRPEEEFSWPGHLASDKDENLYVTDQANNKIVSFTKGGDLIGRWGSSGSGDGEFSRPSGISLDRSGNFVVVDTGNNRIQRYTISGEFLGQFGSLGSADGEFKQPWGTFVDQNDNIFVADWGNNRIQKFDLTGNFLATFGTHGTNDGELDHPAAVAVDKDGDVYVADWGNHRVVVYETDGTFLVNIDGDATNLSRWAELAVSANPDLQKALERVDLEPMSKFWHPSAIHVGDDYKIMIAEAQHQRIQIYQKDPDHQEAQFTL